MSKFYFYSKSADKAPGKGANEIVVDPSEYSELAKIKDWRKVLSNFHVSPFVFEGFTYNSIEHVFQSKKIELVSPEKAFLFTLESGSHIGKGDGLMAQKNRKLVVLKQNDLDQWFKMSKDVMKRAAIEKYAQCPEARTVLKLTGDAELWHIVSRKKPERFVHLEQIR